MSFDSGPMSSQQRSHSNINLKKEPKSQVSRNLSIDSLDKNPGIMNPDDFPPLPQMELRKVRTDEPHSFQPITEPIKE